MLFILTPDIFALFNGVMVFIIIKFANDNSLSQTWLLSINNNNKNMNGYYSVTLLKYKTASHLFLLNDII